MKEKLNLIKVGGAVVEDEEGLKALLDSFSRLPGRKVLVHGGGRTATSVAARLGIETTMVGGRRVTDKDMLDVVTMVYAGLVSKKVVAALQAAGINAIGLSGADLGYMTSVKRPVKDGVDYGYVGDVVKVDADALSLLIEGGAVPVLCSITHDGKGTLLNTNADTIAAEAAKALAALYDVTLTFCFEKKGVLSNPDDEDSVIATITRTDFDRYLADGTVNGGMIPKLQNAFAAIDAGVSRVVITKASLLGSDGGTTIVK